MLIGLAQRTLADHWFDPGAKDEATYYGVAAKAFLDSATKILVPKDPKQYRKIHQALVNGQLTVRYRSRVKGRDSRFREGRLDRLDQALYLNAIGLPDFSLVEIEGTTKSGGVLFNTGWVSADLVRIEF